MRVPSIGLALGFSLLAVGIPLHGQAGGGARTCQTAPRDDLRRYFREVRSVTLQDPDSALVAEVTWVAVSPSGRIAVTDRKDHNVKLFAPDGSFLRVIGRQGQGPAEFESPDVAGFLGDSLFMVADSRLARATVLNLTGAAVRQAYLPGRPIGGIVVANDSVVIPGFATTRDDPGNWSLGTLLAGSDPPRQISRLPADYASFPVLLTGPVLAAPPPRAAGLVLLSWRFGGELLLVDRAGGTERRVRIPATGGFVDPLGVVRGLSVDEIRHFVDKVAMVITLSTTEDFVVIGYVRPGTGARPVRYKVFDAGLHEIATGLKGPAIIGHTGTSLVAMEEETTSSGGITWSLHWYEGCSR